MSDYIEGKTGSWEVVIGLEVHCQILSKAKLFSQSATTFGNEPNSNVSFIDAGLPGVLPRANKKCIEQAVKTGLALNGSINNLSLFDRKHYFYPDLPFGYQITQFYRPIMEKGSLKIELENETTKVIEIDRLHIEQDAGKLLHDHHPTKSLVDLNRAGVGLMEIVSAPDLRSKEEAASYVNSLRLIVKAIGSCDGNMEEGSMRCDINISVRKPGEGLRNRVEIKNVNSIRFLQQAIDYEVNRQIELWEKGETVLQETRLFNAETGKTYVLREKDDFEGYRYIRDPDILPVYLEESYIQEIKDSLPELPNAKKERFINQYKLNAYEAGILTADKDYSKFFEKALYKENGEIRNPKTIASWITTNLFAFLNQENIVLSESPITPLMLGELIDLTEEEIISGKIAKEVFDIMWKSPQSPLKIVEERGLKQITDTSLIEQVIDELCQANLDKVDQVKQGKEKLLGWFVGQVMQKTQGKANPEIVNKLLRKKILE